MMLPQQELEDIKALLLEMRNTLKAKEQAEIDGQWIESSQARQLLGISQRTWQSMRDNRVLGFSQYGRKIYVRRADLEEFMSNHYIKAKN